MKMNPNMEKEVESNRPPTMDLLDDEFDMESPSFISPTNTDKPMKKTPLSEVSKQFDRDGKGYLDETELALRRMDSQNLGYLTVHKVYSIMQSLQTEQKKSAQLLRALDRQQKESLFLKKGILGLCVFAVLLALSNIGTSFAAAKLAKEVVVSTETGDLNNIATVSKSMSE